jgi:hypothetical protein
MARDRSTITTSTDRGGDARREVEREISALLGELAEMARTISERLDERTAKLERLIQAADERIETLRSLQAEPAAQPSPTVKRRERPITAAAEPQPTLWGEQHAEIFALVDQGMGAADIAKRLGRPKGEVELILALRRKQ